MNEGTKQWLLIRQSDKYPVIPGPDIYPVAVLVGLNRGT